MTELNQPIQATTGVESLARPFGLDFRSLVESRGFLTACRIKFARLRYIVWLWSLREVQIIKHLTLNFEKVPKGTMSRAIVLPFAKFAFMKKLLQRIDAKLQKRLI